MGKKIAIVITVSEYDKLSALPGCRNDGVAMQRLLEATGEYDAVYKNETFGSGDIKDLLRGIHTANANSNIDEIFFYFSGHGTVLDADFFYCAKDFDENSPSSTGVQNGEIDTIFRDLAPKTFVKVIDACHSGFKLIKEGISLEKALQQKTEFSDYICFCSSMEDQSSFASSEISFFTKEFIIGATKTKTEKVLYIDLQNYLIDAFRNDPKQHPYFITQWSGTQVFCDQANLVSGIDKTIFEEIQQKVRLPTPAKSSMAILDAVQAREGIFVTLDEAKDSAEKFSLQIETIRLNEELSMLYEFSVKREEPYKEVPRMGELARLLAGQQVSNLMVEIKYIQVEDEDIYPPLNPFLGKQKRYRSEASSITPKAEISLPWFNLEAIPKYRSIPVVGMAIVLIPSRTRCRIFSSIVEYRRASWDNFAPRQNSVKWEGSDYAWKELGELPQLNFLSRKFEDAVTSAARSAIAKE